VRLFVAVDPPPAAVTELDARLAPLRAEWPTLRWADPEQWHLTLTFCGETTERTADRLAERLSRAAARHAALELRLSGAGGFPRPKRAGVLWCGVAGDAAGLIRLAASTSAAARRCGITVEDRRYRPHLTVARVTTAADLRPLVDAVAAVDGPGWTAREIHLVRSHLGRPTVHERIGTWPLGVRPPGTA
jgi:RNA 2',3'-cyclic 3'-phosphodiesterase